jgi:hypothetical protein
VDWPGLIRELKSGGWKLFAVVFLVASAITAAQLLSPATFPEPFPKTIATARLIALASAVVLCCYLLAWLAALIGKRSATAGDVPTPKALRSRFSSLNTQQLALLREVYRTGKRTFPWHRPLPLVRTTPGARVREICSVVDLLWGQPSHLRSHSARMASS